MANRRELLKSWIAAIAATMGTRPSPARAASPGRVGRRVVTGFDTANRSVIVTDGIVPENAITRRPGRFTGYDLWLLQDVPADPRAPDPLAGYHPRLEPREHGIVTRITTFDPGSKYPPHQTGTVDFGVVISGQMELVLDEGSTIIGPGEVVIQRATRHAWRVHGDEQCTMLFVLVAATAPAADADLLSAVHAFVQAWGRVDVAACEKLLDAEYLHTDVSGAALDRAAWLAYMRTRPPDDRFDVVESDIAVRTFGDVAVVTGRDDLSRPGANQPWPMRFTQVWIRRRDGWRRAFFEGTPIQHQALPRGPNR